MTEFRPYRGTFAETRIQKALKNEHQKGNAIAQNHPTGWANGHAFGNPYMFESHAQDIDYHNYAEMLAWRFHLQMNCLKKMQRQ
eukprot:4886418-Amphidinium_carterae.1